MTLPDIEIREDDVRGTAIIALLERHLAHAHASSPPGTVYALDLDGLRQPDVTMWTAWRAKDLVGCGALKHHDARFGEIKSMHTAEDWRGRGVGGLILDHLIHVAQSRNYRALYLETGNNEAFEPARHLYARHGFVECGRFADYGDNGFSFFMKLDLL